MILGRTISRMISPAFSGPVQWREPLVWPVYSLILDTPHHCTPQTSCPHLCRLAGSETLFSRPAFHPALGPRMCTPTQRWKKRLGKQACFFLCLCSLWFLSLWLLWCGWLKRWAPGTIGIRCLLRCLFAFFSHPHQQLIWNMMKHRS